MLDLKSNVDLTGLNTFGFAVTAERFVRVTRHEQLPPLCDYCREKALPLLILGGGSNLVLSDRLPGVTAHIALQGWKVDDEDDGWVSVTVGAGESWQATVERTLDEGLYGLENLALIYGTVGAAPVQNIGAYGVELKEYVRRVLVYDRVNRRFDQLSQQECRFGYRDSVFKSDQADRFIITAVKFRLSRKPSLNLEYEALEKQCRELAGKNDITPHHVFAAVCRLRRSKLPDPCKLGNVGSFFKNPVVPEAHYKELLARFPALPAYAIPKGGYKLAAGWLIEQCGWKGRNMGRVGVYEKQALVLVNRGGGNRRQVERLAAAIHTSVQERFGVSLEPEPRFYPPS